MPSPTNSVELLDLVRKSGVVEEKRLEPYVEQLRAQNALPEEPAKLAGFMVRDGVLTHFQAEQFLLGKWRRFTIGKYKVLERIGAGGMGSVYLCEHKIMRRRVAVKVLPTAKADDPAALDRFYLESRAVAALDHPNIVRAYDIDQDDKLHFLVMEHVDGSNLQELVKKSGPLDPTRCAHYMRQATLGLQHAHDFARLVHRDIKPGNILVDRNGVVKILDMGLARFFHDQDESITKKYDENVLGTADYLAPEQAINSHEVDIRADIYSLGATFYFCLTGKTPFSEGSVAQKLIWHQTRQPKSIKLVRPEVSDALIAIVEKAMAKDPNARYQTPHEMGEALSPFTLTPIAPPTAAELPQFSRAAMGNVGDSSIVTGAASVAGRRPWQVANAVISVTPPPPTTHDSGVPPGELFSRGDETRPLSTEDSGPPIPAKPPSTPAQPQLVTPPAPPTEEPNPLDFTPAPSAVITVAKLDPAVADEAESPNWTELAGDTEDITARVDTSPSNRSVKSKLPAKKKATAVAAKKPAQKATVGGFEKAVVLRAIAYAVGGATLGLLLLWLINWWFASPTKPIDQTGPRVRTINGRDIVAAVGQARPGEILEIEEDFATTEVNFDNAGSKALTIRGKGGRAVTWSAVNGAKSRYLLVLRNAIGWTLKDIRFDGGGTLPEVVSLQGKCPGLTLDHVGFTGYVNTGIRVTNCAGTRDRPITLSHLQFAGAPTSAGLQFDINPKMTPALNQFFNLKDCMFQGGGDKIRVQTGKVLEDCDFGGIATTDVPQK